MASRRVSRALHKDANRSRVADYSSHLGRLFDAWLGGVADRGYSASELTSRLGAAAQEWFPQAFANGRHQAYPKRRPSAQSQGALETKLLANRHYLQNSLGPDIDDRVVRFRLAGETGILSDALRASFRSRITDQYGGALWNVTEAGYLAGVAMARRDLAIRMTGRIHAEADDEEDPRTGDSELAMALGLTVVGLLVLIRSGRDRSGAAQGPTQPDAVQVEPVPGVLEAAGIDVLIDYEAEADACDPCAQDAAEGPYSEDDCPIPGDDCEGLNNCRCSLSTLVDSGT